MSLFYEHIASRGAYGEFLNNVYERLRERHREVWFGSDGSGLITETWIRSSFFSDGQRERWESGGRSVAHESPTPSIDRFPAGRLPGHGPMLAQLPTGVAAVAAKLEARNMLTLHSIGDLIGEALVADQLRRVLHLVGAGLPGAEVLSTATDELGRTGHGIARVEHERRVELIFDPGTCELLGSREVLIGPDADYARPGALIGWTSYLSREIVDSLPSRRSLGEER